MNKQSVEKRAGLASGRGLGVFRWLALLGTFCAVLGLVELTPGASARAGLVGGEQDQSGAGVTFSKQATAKDVGLPQNLRVNDRNNFAPRVGFAWNIK